MGLREPDRRLVFVNVGEEATPHDAFEKGAHLRYMGRTWLVTGLRIKTPEGVVEVQLLASQPQEGAEVIEWDPTRKN